MHRKTSDDLRVSFHVTHNLRSAQKNGQHPISVIHTFVLSPNYYVIRSFPVVAKAPTSDKIALRSTTSSITLLIDNDSLVLKHLFTHNNCLQTPCHWGFPNYKYTQTPSKNPHLPVFGTDVIKTGHGLSLAYLILSFSLWLRKMVNILNTTNRFAQTVNLQQQQHNKVFPSLFCW